MKKIILIIIAISFFSCQKEKRLSLEGNWQFDTIISLDESKGGYLHQKIVKATHYNFTIKNDSIIHFNKGFFDVLYIPIRRDSTMSRAVYYLGTQTDYFIKDSLLIYYDKFFNKNDTIKLLEISSNELILKTSDDLTLKLVKKVNNYFDSSKYDAITISKEGCMGFCPINFTYLNRNGNFYFKNKDNNATRADISTKLDKKKTIKLFNFFDKINLDNLEDNYYESVTDSENIYISYFKNGKIIKTISVYVKCPIELEEAINELSFAYQNVPKENDYESILGYDWSFGFQFENNNLTLLGSESAFLEVELSKAKKVNIKFDEKFEIDPGYFENKGKYKKILTDGRYYKFILKDNSSFVVDLGYNFIDKNPILKKDRIF